MGAATQDRPIVGLAQVVAPSLMSALVGDHTQIPSLDLVRIATGQHRQPRRRAERAVAVGVVKSITFFGQPIQIGRSDDRMTRIAHGGSGVFIRKKKDDVHPLCSHLAKLLASALLAEKAFGFQQGTVQFSTLSI